MLSSRDYKRFPWIITPWQWLFKLQTRGCYFLFTSFWFTTIVEAKDSGFSLIGIHKIPLIFISSLMIALEFLLSLLFEAQFCYTLPTKNFLSSKNNTLSILTLIQKLIIQIILLVLRSNHLAGSWVASAIGLFFCVLRDYEFFTKLPLYHIKALYLQRQLLSAVLCLYLAYFLTTILKEVDYEGANVNFLVTTWLVIYLLGARLSHQILNAKILHILSSSSVSCPDLLLHRVIAIRELKKYEARPGDMSLKYRYSFLVSMNLEINLENILGLSLEKLVEIPGSVEAETAGPESFGEDLLQKRILKRIYLIYLEDLLKRFPKHNLIQLLTAQRCFKNSEPYTKTMRIAARIEVNKLSMDYLSSSLLIHEIEKSIRADNNNMSNKRKLDLSCYIRSKILVDESKKRMLQQANLEIKVCENVLCETPDIEEIYSSGQKISRLKSRIYKEINILSHSLPENYISPFLFYAEYFLVVNHSVPDFQKYCQIYAQKQIRSDKFFQDPQLSQENLFQETNAFVLVSSQKSDCGKILFCNKSLVNLCGGDSTQAYIGTHITRLFPPTLRSYYDNLLKKNLRAEDHSLMNKIHRAYLYHKNKSIVNVDFCIKFHPYLAQGLCLNMVIRPVPMESEYILLREDGDIEGASKNISKLLRLGGNSSAGKSISVGALSEKLYVMNLAFNIILKKGGFENNSLESDEKKISKSLSTARKELLMESSQGNNLKMSEERALEIFSAYTQEDQEIQLHPYVPNNINSAVRNRVNLEHTFFSRVKVVSYGNNIHMKLIFLRAIAREEDFDLREHDLQRSKIEIDGQQDPNHLLRLFSVDMKNENQTSNREELEEEIIPSEFFEAEESPSPQKVFRKIDLGPTSPGATTHGDMPLLSVTSENKRFFADTMVSSFRNKTEAGALTDKGYLQRSSSRREKGLKRVVEIPCGSTQIMSLSTDGDERFNGAVGQYDLAYVKYRIRKYRNTHHFFQKSKDKGSNTKIFQAAIVSKSYPRSFNILCLIFYGVVLSTFIAQILMKIVSDSTMEDLQIKKNLLKYSQERSFKAALIQINAIGLSLQVLGSFQSGGAVTGIETTVANLQIRMRDMKEANDNMLQYIYSLDEDIQRQLFAQDVLINGTYLNSLDTVYKMVNTFEVVQEISNAVKALDALPNATSLEGYHILNFLSINIMDDFQYKSIEITDLFVESVKNQKQTYQNTIDLCLMLTPFLLTGIGSLLCVIIWNQYRIGKKNMKAFIKIPPIGVKEISEQLSIFKNCLVNQETFEAQWLSAPKPDPKSSVLVDPNLAASAKKVNDREIKYYGFQQRYHRYILKVVFFISLLIVITIWDLISTRRAIKVIYNRQDQLQFANYISSRVTAGHAAYPLVFAKNNTLKVEHKIALDALYDAAEDTKYIQAEIPVRFLEVDQTYNPEVKRILYENNPDCNGFASDTLINCQTLIGLGQPVNMLVANSAYEVVLSNKYQDYINCNKTTMAQILTAAYLNIQTLLPNFAVIAYEAQNIADIMDKSMTEKISETKELRLVILVIFSASLLSVSILIWFHILKVIREVHNDFKKVLQVFPSNLVLSSYLLKKFLRQSSNQQYLFK